VRGTKLTEHGSRSKHPPTRLNLGDTKVAIRFFISMREVNGVSDHLFVKADKESFGLLVPILQMLTQNDICGRHYHSVFDQTPTGTGSTYIEQIRRVRTGSVCKKSCRRSTCSHPSA